MERSDFDYRLEQLLNQQEELIVNMNEIAPVGNGIVSRYVNPVLTAAHTPIFWRYDLNYDTNPNLLERLGVNAVFNCGAMEFEGNFVLAVRVEGVDRKSFFAIAESHTGIDGFQFWDYPITMPETEDPDEAAQGAAAQTAEVAGLCRGGDVSKILVVDDDRAARLLLQKSLEDAGFSVSVAGDGGDALKLLGAERFDLMLLDLWMPKVSGLDLLSRLRTKKSRPRIIVMPRCGR